jgi:hypothetical protein
LDADCDELLALAGKAPSDVGEMLEKSHGARTFFRSAIDHGLSEDDWQELLDDFRKKKNMRFYRNQEIETIAKARLAEYEQRRGSVLSLPVDIELFGELILDLSILWEPIEELNGEVILAGLRPDEKVIVMNERRFPLFNKKH